MQPAAEVITPLVLDRSRTVLDGFGFRSLARLKAGETISAANADIARMVPIWLNAWPLSPNLAGRQAVDQWRITPAVQPLKDEVVGSVGDMLWVLMGTIAVVLLIACANVANLMLARSESRRHEFAVRTSLGAGRGHLAREVLVESLVLSFTGGLVGIALAYVSLRVVVATAPTTLPRLGDIALDPRAIAFAIAATLFSTVLFGALPALRAAVQHAPLPGGARGASASRERQRTRNSLVVVQVALAIVLLVGSGLMIRTFQALLNVAPGFSTAGDVQTARVSCLPSRSETRSASRGCSSRWSTGSLRFRASRPSPSPVPRRWRARCALQSPRSTSMERLTRPARRRRCGAPSWYRPATSARSAPG
jgi:hypothetical protein